MTERFVLDTSAIFALTDQAEGGDRVEELLDRAGASECEVSVCAISLMELYYIALQNEGDDLAAQLVTLVKSWPVFWIYPEERDLLLAARFKAFHRLSLADALIAAIASDREATLIHKDPEFNALADEVSLLALPFKGS